MGLPRKPIVIFVSIGVGLLHFVKGPSYKGPFKLFVNGYMIDLLLPFSLVLLLGVGSKHIAVMHRPFIRAIAVLGIAFTVEFLQYAGLPVLGETFDPWDVVMYILGVCMAIIFEKLAFDPMATEHPSDSNEDLANRT